ncbi:uncharacterized protein JCM6883_006328 [Sporobolomyces salmoneus]|uniref:uncharacterized protein n=1 Tax=Sporobolomyces salmoneus TaxID=183962 RepID=UPI003170DC23
MPRASGSGTAATKWRPPSAEDDDFAAQAAAIAAARRAPPPLAPSNNPPLPLPLASANPAIPSTSASSSAVSTEGIQMERSVLDAARTHHYLRALNDLSKEELDKGKQKGTSGAVGANGGKDQDGKEVEADGEEDEVEMKEGIAEKKGGKKLRDEVEETLHPFRGDFVSAELKRSQRCRNIRYDFGIAFALEDLSLNPEEVLAFKSNPQAFAEVAKEEAGKRARQALKNSLDIVMNGQVLSPWELTQGIRLGYPGSDLIDSAEAFLSWGEHHKGQRVIRGKVKPILWALMDYIKLLTGQESGINTVPEASLREIFEIFNPADVIQRIRPRSGVDVGYSSTQFAPRGYDHDGKRRGAPEEPLSKMAWEHKPMSDITLAKSRFSKEGRDWFDLKGEAIVIDVEGMTSMRWKEGLDYSLYARCAVLGRTEDLTLIILSRNEVFGRQAPWKLIEIGTEGDARGQVLGTEVGDEDLWYKALKKVTRNFTVPIVTDAPNHFDAMMSAAQLFKCRRLGVPGSPWTKVPSEDFWKNVNGTIILPIIGDNNQSHSLTCIEMADDFAHVYGGILKQEKWSVAMLSAFSDKVPGQPPFSPPGLNLPSSSTIDLSQVEEAEVDRKVKKCVLDVRQEIRLFTFRRELDGHAISVLLAKDGGKGGRNVNVTKGREALASSGQEEEAAEGWGASMVLSASPKELEVLESLETRWSNLKLFAMQNPNEAKPTVEDVKKHRGERSVGSYFTVVEKETKATKSTEDLLTEDTSPPPLSLQSAMEVEHDDEGASPPTLATAHASPATDSTSKILPSSSTKVLANSASIDTSSDAVASSSNPGGGSSSRKRSQASTSVPSQETAKKKKEVETITLDDEDDEDQQDDLVIVSEKHGKSGGGQNEAGSKGSKGGGKEKEKGNGKGKGKM